MWYVIQTITGKEQELVEVIDRVLAGCGYEKCFVIRRECVWRIEGQYRVHLEMLFPSYVFVETDMPEIFFFALKRIPKLTKLLGGDGLFWTVKREEEELLRRMVGGDETYIVRRSPVKVDEAGEIISAGGILKEYLGQIVKKRLRKRSVVIEIPFLGERKRVQVGILVEGEEAR